MAYPYVRVVNACNDLTPVARPITDAQDALYGPKRISPLPAPQRKLLWLPYKVTQFNQSIDCAFDAEILVDGQDPTYRANARNVIVDLSEKLNFCASPPNTNTRLIDSIPSGNLFGVYAGFSNSTTPQYIQSVRDAADEFSVPIFAYFETSTFPTSSELTDTYLLDPAVDWISPQLYLNLPQPFNSEGPTQFYERAHGILQDVCSRGFSNVFMTVQMYDRSVDISYYQGYLSVLNIIQSYWLTLANSFTNIKGIAPFAMVRQGGISDYKFLQRWYDYYAWQLGATGADTFPDYIFNSPSMSPSASASPSASPSSSFSPSTSLSLSWSPSSSKSPSASVSPSASASPSWSPSSSHSPSASLSPSSSVSSSMSASISPSPTPAPVNIRVTWAQLEVPR